MCGFTHDLPFRVFSPLCCRRRRWRRNTIGLYRDVWIAAIASSTTSLATRTAAICVRFQGWHVRRVYVTMQITFLTRKSALIYRRGLRQRVASLTLNCNGDFAIRATMTLIRAYACSQAEQFTFLFVIHFSATPILAARARCMFIISYNYDARIAVH